MQPRLASALSYSCLKCSSARLAKSSPALLRNTASDCEDMTGSLACLRKWQQRKAAYELTYKAQPDGWELVMFIQTS